MRYPYEVVLSPGCHGDPGNPVVSRHRTLAAAVRVARRSDRLQVERTDSARVLYAAPRRDHPRYGAGCFGRGPLAGEPSLAECIAAAAARDV